MIIDLPSSSSGMGLSLGKVVVARRSVATAVDHDQLGARPALLYSCLPNSFNPNMQIRFELQKDAWVSLRVYDASGVLVKTVVNEQVPHGSHLIRWDGRNEKGTVVASGVHFCQMKTVNYVGNTKLLVAR
jgi:hypothetical protein